jgi:transposase
MADKTVLSARLKKPKRADAKGLAQLVRTGWFTKVHIHSEASRHNLISGA